MTVLEKTSDRELHDLLYVKPYLVHSRLTLLKTGVRYDVFPHGVLKGRRVASNTGPRSAVGVRRKDNTAAVRARIHDLVECNNLQYGYEPVFLTFTFAENVTDIKTAWKEWHKYVKRHTRAFGKPKYLSVMEFQKRGAVHFHAIFFNLDPELEYRERETRCIAKAWGNGFITVERIRSVHRVGRYVCKYLNKSAEDVRLRGQKFFTTSNDLFRPVVFYGEKAREKYEKLPIDKDTEECYIDDFGNSHFTSYFVGV